LESVYEECLCHELSVVGVAFERQKFLPLRHKGVELHTGYRLDLVVGGQLLVEIKAVERLLPVHEAQVITVSRITELFPSSRLHVNLSPALDDRARRARPWGSHQLGIGPT
jgi:GxxExxY protein